MYSHAKIVFVALNILISVSSSYGTPVKSVFVSGGEEHSMVLDESGMVWTCGDNSLYQLGHDEGHTVFNLVLDGDMATDSNFLEDVNGINAGWQHSLALDVNGFVWAWGDNDLWFIRVFRNLI